MTYDDVAFRNKLEEFLKQGQVDCSRGESRQQSRFQIQYDQERHSKDRVDIIKKAVGGIKGKKVLEVGCGSGGLTVAVALEGAIASAVEPDLIGHETCLLRKERYQGINVRFECAGGELLPFENEEFDVVFMFSVIEHVRDPYKTIEEMYRVLRKGGICLIDAPNYLWPREQHYRMFYPPLIPKPLGRLYLRAFGKNPAELDHINYVTPGAIYRLLRRAGFSDIYDLSKQTILEKLAHPDDIGYSKRAKRLLIALRTTGPIYRFVITIVSYGIKLGFYPIMKIKAVKN